MRIAPPAARKRLAVLGVSMPARWSTSHMRLCSRNLRRNTSVERSAMVKSPLLPAVLSSFSASYSGRSSSRSAFSSARACEIFHSPTTSARNMNAFLATTHSASTTATISPNRMSSNMLYFARSIMEMESVKRNEPEPPMARMK